MILELNYLAHLDIHFVVVPANKLWFNLTHDMGVLFKEFKDC